MCPRLAGILTAGALLFLFGCSSMPKPVGKLETVTNIVHVQSPEPLYERAFASTEGFGKDKLETTAEYEARIAAMGSGLTGQDVTLLLSPTDCDVAAYPDDHFYVIETKDTYDSYYGCEESYEYHQFGLMVKMVSAESRDYTEQNRFGVEETTTIESGTKLMIRVTNLAQIPDLRWKHHTGDMAVHFGVPYRTAAANDADFRSALRAGLVGIVVRGTIDSLANAETTYQSFSASHVLFIYTVKMLPVKVTEAWLVRTDTMTSYVHWTLGGSEAQTASRAQNNVPINAN